MAFPPRDAYERFIYSLPTLHPEIQSSTLHLYTNSPTTCLVRGSIWFRNGLELRVFEYLDFAVSFTAPDLPTLIADCIALSPVPA